MQPSIAADAPSRTRDAAAGKARSSQIPSLDGIRAVSITIVLASHAGISHLIPGGFGVTLFFFLSGYLITTLLCREYDLYGRIAIGHFYVRRVIRLGPPLLIVMTLSCAAVWAGLARGDLSPGAILSQLFFYYNYYSLYGGEGDSVEGLGILWSLSVEEHFYIVWPALFLAIGRGRVTLGHVVAALVAILAGRMVRHSVLGASEWEIYISTDTRLDSLLYGCLLALLDWRGLSSKIFPTGGASYLVLAAAIIAIGLSFVVRDDFFRSTLRYSFQGIALMPLFHYAVAMPGNKIFRPLNWEWMKKLGVYSYTMYLVHYVVINGLAENGAAVVGSLEMFLLAAVISVVISGLVHEFVEKPLHPLRKRLTGH